MRLKRGVDTRFQVNDDLDPAYWGRCQQTDRPQARANGEEGESCMNATTTVGGGPQCMRALQRANEVRLARAELKREIAEGAVSAAEVILRCPSPIEKMTVSELLMSQRRWGRTRCRKYLMAVPLSETKTVGSMTERQRRALAAMLADPETTASAVQAT